MMDKKNISLNNPALAMVSRVQSQQAGLGVQRVDAVKTKMVGSEEKDKPENNAKQNVKEDVKQMYRMLCYSEMSLVYIDLFYSKISDSNNRYYNMSEMTENYLTNIAQLRILGEEEQYDFYKNDGIFSGLVNLFNNSEEVRENTNNSIKYIRKHANTLHLTLSNNIKYEV